MNSKYLIFGGLGLLALYLFTRPKTLTVGQTYSGNAAAYNPPYYGPPLGTSAESAPSNLSTVLNTVGVLASAGASIYDDYTSS